MNDLNFVRFLINRIDRKRKEDKGLLHDSPTVPLKPRGTLTARVEPNETLQPMYGDNRTNYAAQPMAQETYKPTMQVDVGEQPTAAEINLGQRNLLATNPALVARGTNVAVGKTPSRVRGFIQGFLQASSQAANQAMAQGRGDWGAVAQALGGGLAGGAGMAVNPALVVKQRNAADLAAANQRVGQDFAIQGEQAKLDEFRSKQLNRESLTKTRDRVASIREATERRKAGHEDWNEKFQEDRQRAQEAYRAGLISLGEANVIIKQAEADERVAHDSVSEKIAQQNADANTTRANNPSGGSADNSQEIDAQAAAIQREIDDIVKSQQGVETRKPIFDRSDGHIVGYEEGTITDVYAAGQKRIKELREAKDKLYAESRKEKAKAKSSSKPAAPRIFNVKQWQADPRNSGVDVNAAIEKLSD